MTAGRATDTSTPASPRLHMVDGRVVDEIGIVYDIATAIAEIPWVTAVMYPPPHEYVVRGRCPDLAWRVVATAIAHHRESYLAFFRGYQRPMRYWEFEGRRYWRTASGGGRGIVAMLNRARLEDSEPPRRVDAGAVPIRDWVGPPWDINGSEWPAWYPPDADGVHRYRRDLDPYRHRPKRP